MPLFRHLPSIVMVIAFMGVAMPAFAQQGRGQRGGERAPEPPLRVRGTDSVSDAVRRIERSNRGQVLSAERMQYDGRDVTRIKVVDDEGRVRIYMDDAPQDAGRRRENPPRETPPPRRRDDD